MEEVAYKGYLIQAIPYQLAESGEWTIRIEIWRDRGNAINAKAFYAKNRFKTKEEAIPHCFEIGKQIVDGRIANCNVDDL